MSFIAGRQMIESFFAHRWLDRWQVELVSVRHEAVSHAHHPDSLILKPLKIQKEPSSRTHEHHQQAPKINSTEVTSAVERVESQSLSVNQAIVQNEVSQPTSPRTSYRSERIRYQERVQVNINTADSATLTSIKGIGPVLSRRIIKYRTRLGGFHQVDQLKEVYGINMDYWDALTKQVVCSGEIAQIDVCNETFKAVLRHPYLDYDQVKAIKQVCDKMHKPGHNDRLEDLRSKLPSGAMPYLILPMDVQETPVSVLNGGETMANASD